MSTSTMYYATGRRKTAIARVWVKPGKGEIKINHREMDDYFGRKTLRMVAKQPLGVVEGDGEYNIYVNVSGGGLAGQAGAIRLGISRALQTFNTDFRGPLKKAGLLTRDARKKERKKYGLAGARRAFQFSKR
ncbi:MAG: 30S ribosomal protein S9 [Candidatus Marinimicrobia bacterium]|nr:30S ribosomal protein S9 [Candidatus Neomarinimicrobiota bacterium]MCF7840150.1 30S ribosomal protein S9 [Candidatus Neomarinimicrobiota bacterium]MCF7903482.1 30S ribosomal protein S9 [Candidatus Neomarinimicrobiota bacterium]